MNVPELAHIVGGGPVWPLWVTATLLFGGALAALAVGPPQRRACLAVAGVGLVATIVVYVLLPAAPAAPPGVSLSIAAPPSGVAITSPVVVRACAGAVAVPGAGRLLSISVDGRQVAEVTSNTTSVTVTVGVHDLRVELVTADHREYAPPVLSDETISVSGVGPLSAPPDCPRPSGG